VIRFVAGHDLFMNQVTVSRAVSGSDDRESSKGVIIWRKGSMIWSVVSAPDDIEITITLNGVLVQQERFPSADNAMDFLIDQMLAYEIRVH
jgi:hypothetical protein